MTSLRGSLLLEEGNGTIEGRMAGAHAGCFSMVPSNELDMTAERGMASCNAATASSPAGR